MVYIFFLTVSLCFILPVKLNKYDIILVPISNKPVNIKNWRFNIFGEHTHLRSELNSRNNALRIDIENYEEPTDIPDLDNFDYFKDRSESKWNDNGYHSESNEYKNKNNKGSDMNFNYYPSELKGNRNSRAKDDEYDNSQSFGDDKIVGGKEVDINLYPYHVAYGSNCGGAIIDKKWVITAGHCGKKPYVKVGSKYLNQGEKVSIKRSIIHPNWSAKNKDHPFDYDFQLLELAHPLKYSDNIQPIKIANMEDMVIGKIITVTGWGNTQENGPYSSVLRAVRVPIISKENCQNVPFPYFRGTLTARMFCAGFPEGKKDACQGDSGGPAVAYDRLLGMVSFGYGCATPGSYGVYSKVAKVRSWIEQHTRLTLD